VKAGPSFQAWLVRRIDEGADLDRVRRQIERWRESPPPDTNAALFEAMLAELDKASGSKAPAPKPSPPTEARAFD
jgi:hypothetical protein